MKKVTEKKKFKLKKSARLTIAGVCAATALVVAAIPTRKIEAIADYDTEIPEDVDEAISIDPFVNSNGVAVKDTGAHFWAFPVGEALHFEQNVGVNKQHNYYKIDREGMTEGYDAMPVFEVAAIAPSGTEVNCISHYVGGEGSGYTPVGGNLKLSPTLIYAAPDTLGGVDPVGGGDQYININKNGDTKDSPYIWTRYTEHLREHAPNDSMIQAKDNDPDPLNNYYYYDIDVEVWEKPWEQLVPGDDTSWVPPTEPNFATDPATSLYSINEVCKKVDGTNFGYQLVSYIADDAFKDVTNIKTIDVLSEEGTNNGIVQIGNSAFENCFNLTSISFGGNFKKLGSKAFCNCTALQSVDFNMTESIGDGAFAYCSTLPEISLPIALTQLGTAAFFGCSQLSDAIPDFHTEDDKNSRIFGGMASDTPLTVGSYAFCNCTNLKETKMARTLQKIVGTHGQYGMYAGCSNLEQVELPSQTAGFMTTKSTFLGCPNLKCVRANNYTDTCTEREFINSLNIDIEAIPPEKQNVSDDFVLWGPNPNVQSSEIYTFSQRNSLPYMYYDTADNRFKYIMTLVDTYKFTFTDDFVIQKIEQIKNTATPENKKLLIPASIGGHPIQAIADNACGYVSGTTYKSYLTLPETIEIADAIGEIGANAFRACGSVKEVSFIHIPFTDSADQTRIGEACFKDCDHLEIVRFRDDNFSGNGYYDINIDETSVGADAFLTENPNGLVMVGKMDPNYWPYKYAINPENTSCSKKADSYITYRSGNPVNLECKYSRPNSSQPGYVTLLSYPTLNTVVAEGVLFPPYPEGTGTYHDKVTILDLIEAYDQDPSSISPNQEAIINQFTKNIQVPAGITSIALASNDLGTEIAPDLSDNDYFIRTNDYKSTEPDPSIVNPNWPYNLTTISFDSLESLPNIKTSKVVQGTGDVGDTEKAFADSKGLKIITYNGNVKDLGVLPFYNVATDLVKGPISELIAVNFYGENSRESATIDDPYYWSENGIIYAYYKDDDGEEHISLIEVLQSRGIGVGSPLVNTTNDPWLSSVTEIEEDAFRNCDGITSVDLSESTKLTQIPEHCFYNCNGLKTVSLPSSVERVEPGAFQDNPNLQKVTIDSKKINIDEDAFSGTYGTELEALKESSIPSYVKMVNKKEEALTPGNPAYRTKSQELQYVEKPEVTFYKVEFIDYLDLTCIYSEKVQKGGSVSLKNVDPNLKEHPNYSFKDYEPKYANENITDNTTIYAMYEPINTSSTSTTSSTGGGGSTGKTSTTSGSSSSNSSSRSTSITSTTVQPVIVSGTGTPNGAGAVPAINTAANTGNRSTGGGTGTSNNVGKTKLISTTGGITDTSKMSATVNGSSDNYVIKISETQEANEMADKALTAAFGSLDAIRYLPIDISLYDSTGTQKISPIPEGVSINITMPIPDNLAIYGGNAKIACTEGGTLDKIQPKFTVINGVPCMNYTVTHLSPYVVYVDTNNLTATGTLDATPKTGDPIHPKWFLVIGLAAVSGVMFLMRDKKETVEAA